MKIKLSVKQMLEETCPREVVDEVYPCVANVPKLQFMFSGSKRMAQATLAQYRKDPKVILPNFFPLYGDSLIGVDIVLRGSLNVLLVTYFEQTGGQLKQKNLLLVVKEG